jgi:DNA polymerase III subunit beta
LPEMPNPVGSLSGAQFAAAVSQVAIAAGRDDTLPMLLGVRVEITDSRVTMAATDRYRLAVREFDWRPDQPGFEGAALVPAKVLADTAKLLAGAETVSVAYSPGSAGEGLMGFEGDGRRTTTRLLDGEFPKYRQLLPAESTTVSIVQKAALVEAVKRVSLVAERNTPVRLTFGSEELALQAGSGDEARANEALECQTDGETIEIAFNPHYLLDGLGAIESDHVRVAFTGSTRPAVLSASGDGKSVSVMSAEDYKYLLMPVRLSS